MQGATGELLVGFVARGQLYEVTGPRLLTFLEAVGEIATASGREIRYVPASPKLYAPALLEHGLPPDFVTPL